MSDFTEDRNVVLGNRVVIMPDDQDVKTKGGIYIPDSAVVDRPMRGTVMAVGDGDWKNDTVFTKPPVKPGDRVLYSKYAGTDFKIGEMQYIIVSGEDVLMVIERGDCGETDKKNP